MDMVNSDSHSPRCYIQLTEADVVLCQNSHQTPIPSSFSRNRCRGIVNSYGSCSFSLQMFCLLLDSSVTPTMVLSSLQKELKPSIATFSSNGS
ncbi:hypothetical protein L3X38_009840 [Prunus dulcis]|uniref:Uncharacterized protein n=1 Tax=Prunus dulcis TaxID=3755 RepID=A0AAD4ZDH0_PRUDU|nr:hypothetical protein L3X38_009840 [Prunus dulcis]